MYLVVLLFLSADQFFLHEEDKDVLRLRVHLLMDAGLEDEALTLCQWCLRCVRFAADLSLKLTHLILLHKLNMKEQFHTAVSVVIES